MAGESNEPSTVTLAGVGNVQARPRDEAVARYSPIRLPGEADDAFAARRAEGQKQYAAALDAAAAKPEPSKISTDPTPALTSAEADRALAHYNETGLALSVQADLRQHGLSPVSQPEKDLARQYLQSISRSPEKLKSFAEGTDLELNGKISSANIILASPLGQYSPVELEARLSAIAKLRT